MTQLRSLRAVRRALEAGRASARELRQAARARNETLDRGDRPVRAFLSMAGEDDEGRAPSALPGGDAPASGDGAPAAAGGGPLAGVPVAVKDNVCTLGLPTTCASRILQGYRSPYEATAVRQLREAGARVLGKTNMDEFAMGSSTETGAFGATRNPVDRERVPGGSSGGSAAAVAGGVVPVALGSDTGGSVRQPASFCGVVGVKPTYGRVSRYGLVAFASSLDQIGVLANSVADAARTLEVVSGHDPRDATSARRPSPRWRSAREVELGGRVVGLPAQYLGEGLDPAVRDAVRDAARALERGGAELREISLPATEAAVPCYVLIASAEASSNLARFDGVRYGSRATSDGGGDPPVEELYRRTRGRGFGQEVRRRIMMGTYALSAGHYEAYYLRARDLQRELARELREAFREVDALLTPTAPSLPFAPGERREDPYEMYRSDVFTAPASLAGVPAVSVPVDLAGGLPVGAQLVCAPWEDELALGLARRLEERMAFVHPVAERGTDGP